VHSEKPVPSGGSVEMWCGEYEEFQFPFSEILECTTRSYRACVTDLKTTGQARNFSLNTILVLSCCIGGFFEKAHKAILSSLSWCWAESRQGGDQLMMLYGLDMEKKSVVHLPSE
jgi:hypothetical protein